MRLFTNMIAMALALLGPGLASHASKLGCLPRSHSWNPARDASPERVVLRPEFPSQLPLLVKKDIQMAGEPKKRSISGQPHVAEQ
jgi:hypothetical protein